MVERKSFPKFAIGEKDCDQLTAAGLSSIASFRRFRWLYLVRVDPVGWNLLGSEVAARELTISAGSTGFGEGWLHAAISLEPQHDHEY